MAYRRCEDSSNTLRSSWVMTCAFEKDDQFVVGLDNLCTIYKFSDSEDNNRAHRELTGHDGYLSSCQFVGPENCYLIGDVACFGILRRAPNALKVMNRM